MKTLRPLSLILALALPIGSQAIAAQPGPAQLVVPATHTSVAPKIDGVLDDVCWQRACRLSHFRLTTQNLPATQQTVCSFLWDDRALYIGVTCLEKALEPAVQKAHLVRAAVKERDGDVFDDDCVEIFLSPESAKGYFHLAVNAAGTQYDAQGTNASWNADWQAATKIGDGVWTAEVAIPFSALQMKAPSEGIRWRFNLCREEKPEGENSSLCGVQGAFHEPSQFGVLVFARTLPALRDIRVTGDAVGRAHASVTVEAVEGTPPLELRLEERAAQKARVVAHRTWSGGTGKTEKIELDSSGPVAFARLSLQCGGAAILTTLWEEIGAEITELPHIVEARDCDVRVFLRGKQVDDVAAGRASQRPLSLARGTNVLALHCKATGPNPRVNAYSPVADGESFSGWRMRSGFEDSFTAETTDLKPWLDASKQGDGSWGAASAREVTLRRVLYAPKGQPRNWPGMADFTLPENTTQVFYPLLEVPKELPLDDYRVRLDLPANLRVTSVDEVAGAPGQILQDRLVSERRQMEIGIENPYQGGMELNVRWGDAKSATIAYVPAISVAGTCDWRLLRAAVVSPPNARFAHLLLIKWQDRGVCGTAWFDDLVIRKKGSTENLLKVGSFDEPWWQEKEHRNWRIVQVERDGQKTLACRLSGAEKDVKRQDALWVGEPTAIAPNTEYEFEMLVKCENVRSDVVKPRLALAVKHESGALKPDTLRFGFVAMGGYVTEVPATVALTPLPPLLKKRPKESRIIPCYYGDTFNAATSEALAQNVWDSGIGAIYGGHNRVTQALQPKGLQVIWSCPYNAWQLFPAKEWKQQHPDRLAVKFDGKRDEGRICPTYALEQGNEFLPLLRNWVKEAVTNCGYDGIDCDYEVPVVEPPNFCFCSRCLEAFQKRENLATAQNLTPQIVVEKYRDAWTAFRCQQNAEMIGLLARYIRETEPRIRVSAYSGFQNRSTREHYGIDWALLREGIDEGIAGYNGNRENLEATAKALSPRPFIGGEMYYLSDRTNERGPIRREGWKMRLLRTYINSGCHGVLIWYLPPMDGSAFYQTSQAAAIVADFEEFFRKGQRADARISFASELAAEDFAAFEKDGQILLVLFNPTPELRVLKGLAVGGWKKLIAKAYDDQKGFLAPEPLSPKEVTVGPKDAAVLLLTNE